MLSLLVAGTVYQQQLLPVNQFGYTPTEKVVLVGTNVGDTIGLILRLKPPKVRLSYHSQLNRRNDRWLFED
jgi:hypothetical protein